MHNYARANSNDIYMQIANSTRVGANFQGNYEIIKYIFFDWGDVNKSTCLE